MTPELPDISELDSEQLLTLRDTIDARLEEMRGAVIEQAQRLGLAVGDGKEDKRRGRRPKGGDQL